MKKARLIQRAAALILALTVLVGVSGTCMAAGEDRTLIWEDTYTNVDTEDTTAPQSFDKTCDHGDLMVYANTNELFDQETLTMILSPAGKGYVTYDVSDVQFPEAQIQADVAFYADPALITNYVTIWTSKNGTDFTQNSAKLLEDATDLGMGWYLCKVINFAAIPEGTKYIRVQLETPGQGWDVQLYTTYLYEIPAGDINLVPPTISLGENAYPAVEAKDTMITLLDASATDDTTPAENLAVNCTVVSPVDSQVVVTDGQFVLGMYGDYTITYTCMDENGNMAKQSYTITSVDKSELYPETSSGFALWVWIVIAAVAAVAVVAVALLIVKKRGNKKTAN